MPREKRFGPPVEKIGGFGYRPTSPEGKQVLEQQLEAKRNAGHNEDQEEIKDLDQAA